MDSISADRLHRRPALMAILPALDVKIQPSSWREPENQR